MYYRCRHCEYAEARGCLPTVTCGLYMLFLMGCTTAIAAVAIRVIRGHGPYESLGLGWWNVLVIPLAGVVGLVGAFIGSILLNYVLEFIEYVAFMWRKCPKCGARRWSWGYTRGFGL